MKDRKTQWILINTETQQAVQGIDDNGNLIPVIFEATSEDAEKEASELEGVKLYHVSPHMTAKEAFLASQRKPYTAPKLRKLDPRCVEASNKAGFIVAPGFPGVQHVPECKCEK